MIYIHSFRVLYVRIPSFHTRLPGPKVSLLSGPREEQVPRDDAAGSPPTGIIKLLRISIPIQHHDVRVPGVDAVPPEPARAICHSRLVLDAIGSAHRRGAIVARRNLAVEKSPEGRRVEVQVCTTVNVLRQAHATRLVRARTPAEIGVAVTGQGRPWVGGVLQRAHSLPVGRLRLLHSGVDILGLVQVVVIECVMLEGGACEPCSLRRLDQGTPPGGDILMATSLE